MASRRSGKKNSEANLGFEAKLWAAADALRPESTTASMTEIGCGPIDTATFTIVLNTQPAQEERRRSPSSWRPSRRRT